MSPRDILNNYGISRDNISMSTNQILDIACAVLGDYQTEVFPGIFRNDELGVQFRMLECDLVSEKPHVHFEIVNKKGKLETLFVQVKSRFGDSPSSIFTATVKTHTLVNSKKMIVVFCFYDTEEGDLWDYVWLIPANEFIKKANKLDGGKMLGFVAGRKKSDSNKWDQYMIEKNDLSEQIITFFKK